MLSRPLDKLSHIKTKILSISFNCPRGSALEIAKCLWASCGIPDCHMIRLLEVSTFFLERIP